MTTTRTKTAAPRRTTNRDALRGLFALALLIGAFVLGIAIQRPAFEIVAALIAFASAWLFTTNWRRTGTR